MTMLKVKKSKFQLVLLVLLALFFLPMGLFIAVDALRRGGSIAPVLLGVAMLAIFGVVFWLVHRANAQSVNHLTDEGLVRNDGRHLAWADLDRVVYQVRLNRTTGRKGLWRIEIRFKDGEDAWLLPTKVTNLTEITDYVARLPCEQVEERV
jgi:hypothetical protein